MSAVSYTHLPRRERRQRREAVHVVLLVAVEGGDDLHALEEEAHVVLVGDADAAVQLDALARHEESALRQLLLRGDVYKRQVAI